MLIVEQRARAVLAISDRTYVLGGGEVRMEGTPAELAASPEFVESFLGGRGDPPARRAPPDPSATRRSASGPSRDPFTPARRAGSGLCLTRLIDFFAEYFCHLVKAPIGTAPDPGLTIQRGMSRAHCLVSPPFLAPPACSPPAGGPL